MWYKEGGIHMKWVPREREDTADIYWSLAKKSRFLLQESRTWQNRTQQQYIGEDDGSICSSCFFGVIVWPNGYTQTKDKDQILEFETQL